MTELNDHGLIPLTVAEAKQAMADQNLETLSRLQGSPVWMRWRNRHGATMLHFAPVWGWEPAIALPFLLKEGLRLSDLDENGSSIVDHCFQSPQRGRLSWLKALHQQDHDFQTPLNHGGTVLSKAGISGQLDLLDWLIELGLTPNEQDHQAILNSNDKSCVERFWQVFGRPPLEELEGALAAWCKRGRWGMVNAMLDLGVGIGAVDDEGRTPLILACGRRKLHLPLVERLVSLGVDPKARTLVGEGKNALEAYADKFATPDQKMAATERLGGAIAQGRQTRLNHVLEIPTETRTSRPRL